MIICSVLLYDRRVPRYISEAESYFQVYEDATESFFYGVGSQIISFHAFLTPL